MVNGRYPCCVACHVSGPWACDGWREAFSSLVLGERVHATLVGRHVVVEGGGQQLWCRLCHTCLHVGWQMGLLDG